MSQPNQIALDLNAIINSQQFKTDFGNVRSNKDKLKVLLDNAKNKVLEEVDRQKKLTFDRVYGNLQGSLTKNQITMTLDGETRKLGSVQKNVMDNHQVSIQNVSDDKQLAKRKYEMNEWSVQNKKETLFIYSLFFMLITGIVFLSALLNMGMISSTLFTGLIVPFIIIFIFVVIYRARLTGKLRNKRYWNRRDFEDEESRKLRVPRMSMSVCPQND